MISPEDFVHLPYSPDLTAAGIIHACRVLPRLPSQEGNGLYDTMRRTVAATAAQLALRHYLTGQGITFSVRLAAPFSDPDRYYIEVGRRVCELKSFLISRRAQIEALAADPGLALRAPALVPVDRYVMEQLRGDDLYLFAFVSALISAGRVGTRGGAPVCTTKYWMHCMPQGWIRPRSWVLLSPLVLKAESPETLSLELVGEDGLRNTLELTIDLPPGKRLEVDAPFHSLSHIHAWAMPAGRVGIHSTPRKAIHLINPTEWRNIWLEGKDICLLGWITREQFRVQATLIPEGRRVYQFDRTKTKNLALDVARLKPIDRLLDRAREGGI
jgi:hypothetical protein